MGGRNSMPLPILRDINRIRQADVVHIHWLLAYFSAGNPFLMPFRSVLLVFQLLIVKRFTPVIWTAHDRFSQNPAYPRLERVLRRIFVQFICQKVILHCEKAGEILLEEYNLPESSREKFVVIPHPNLDPLYPEPPSRDDARLILDLPSCRGTTYLHFGRMQEYKGTPELIESFFRVGEEGDQLILAGDITEKHFGQELQLAREDDRIITKFGYIENNDVPVYFAAADVVALPYRRVLTSGVVVLSMMYSKPVIAPTEGCIPCQVPRGGGIIYDDGDLDSALQQVKSKDIKQMGKINRERCNELTWQKFAEQTYSLYENISRL